MVYGTAGIGSVLFVMLRGTGKHNPDQKMQLRIPWSSIKAIGPDMDSADRAGVLITVTSFDPTGTIHFYPEGGAAPFLEAAKPPASSPPRSEAV